MKKFFLAVLLAAFALAACNKSPNSSALTPSADTKKTAPSPNVNDPVEKKLQELAGNGATNCGRLPSQVVEQMDAAAKCAMQAAKQKQPFYVAYELPGLIIAVAGNAEGKLFTAQSDHASAGGPAGLASGACPSELRVAPSGRVTCYAAGTFGMGTDATHGGGMTKPATGVNPHQALGIPAPGRVNPHQTNPAPPGKQQ